MKECYNFFDLHESASIAENNIQALNESYNRVQIINEKVKNIIK